MVRRTPRARADRKSGTVTGRAGITSGFRVSFGVMAGSRGQSAFPPIIIKPGQDTSRVSENGMAHPPLRVGLVGAGANTRTRHIPGFRAVEGVELLAVCNRRPESTQAVAREFQIPRTHVRWEDLVADPDID